MSPHCSHGVSALSLWEKGVCGGKCGTEYMFVLTWDGLNVEEVMADPKYKGQQRQKRSKTKKHE